MFEENLDNLVERDLTTALGPNLTLATPVVAASGTFGYGDELAELADCGTLGALITPTLTRFARLGNSMPRTAEVSAGLLHALGLPNPGLDSFVTTQLPSLWALPCPTIVSILGTSPAEWAELAGTLSAAGGVVALELNLAPLELQIAERSAQIYLAEAALLETLAAAVAAARAVTPLPLIAKLPPIGAEVGTAAQVVADAGADVIAVAQAFPGVAVQTSSRQFRFPGVVGGLSGPCIKPLALYQVWRVAQSVRLPILGAGGIMTGEDALEFLIAGASAVAVGVANTIHPTAIARITADLATRLSA